MSEVKKINVGPVLTAPLALAARGGQIASEQFEKHAVSEKVSALKEHKAVAKIVELTEVLKAVLGFVMIFHGAQFKNLFLCTQVIVGFCYERVQSSFVSLFSDVRTAWEKVSSDEAEESNADAKAEPKPDNKHAQKRQAKKEGDKPSKQQREEDAATAKKVLKVLDSDKVTKACFELCVAAMACHMVMEGGLAKAVLVTYALVKASKEKVATLLDFSQHEDLEAWTDLILNFVLYSFFGGMAIVMPSLAFALNIAIAGAQLVMDHGLRIAEGKGKIPDGLSAEAFAASIKGLAVLGGLTAFATLWQFWALLANSGMAWYFKIVYLPAYLAENIVGLF